MEHHHIHRTYLSDSIYFVTTNVRRHVAFFRDRNIAKIAEQSIWWNRGSEYIAYVVMPDHLHLLLQPVKDNISILMQSLKSNSCREINRHLSQHSGERALAAIQGERIFQWQKGFYDHVICDERNLMNHVEYIRYNPMKAGLVEKPEDYPFLFVDDEAVNRALGY